MHRYTQSELDKMNLEMLKSICKERRIKSDMKGFYHDENAMRTLIYKYRGKEEPVIEMEEERIEVEEELIEIELPASEAEEETILEWISEWDHEKIDFLQNAFKTNRLTEIPSYIITMRDDFEVYKDIDALDECKKGYKICFEADQDIVEKADISMTNAFMVDSEGKIQAIFDISERVSENCHYLNLRKGMLKQSIQTGLYNDCKILFFPIDFDKVLHTYHEKNESTMPLSYAVKHIKKMRVREIQETEDILFLDYGSCYTAAAVYTKNESAVGNSVHFTWEMQQIYFHSDEMCALQPDVKTYYADSDCRKCGRCGLCPSIIATKDCKNDHFRFIYGYEAKKVMPLAASTIFTDTKRWLNNIDETVEVIDEAGNASNRKCIEIIKDFLQYIILHAERQTKKRYKNICFLYPFEQKYDSIEIYRKILKDCHIVQATGEFVDQNVRCMSESIAVIYDFLEQNKEEYRDSERKSLLLIDCSSNSSHILKADLVIANRNNGEGSVFDIGIGYERGAPNFGGNKLTYRLMQYIKIQLAHYYQNEHLNSVKDLLGISYCDVYDTVDEGGVKKIYEAFDMKYSEIKHVIPTNFNDYVSEADILKVKKNFYFLWTLAEQIKVYFYENIDAYEFVFDTVLKDRHDYCLSVKNDDGFELYHESPPIRMLREEINLLFKPEIYALMKRLIEPYYDDHTIYDIESFIFVGQTTNIGLFKEVLKEYIEGGKAGARFNPYKKLKNIRGAILYYGDQSIGSISPRITYYPAKQPYYLTAELFAKFAGGNDEKEKNLLEEGQPLCELYSFIDRNEHTKKIALTLKDYHEDVLQVFEFEINKEQYQKTNENELKQKYIWFACDRIERQGDIDRIARNSLRVFVYGDDKKWGFSWLCVVKKEDGSLYCSEEHFVAFKTAYTDYFDGRR